MKIHFLPFLGTFVSKIREKISRNRRYDKKCLEIGENIFSHFWTLLGLEIREKVCRNRKNNIKCLYTGEIVFFPFLDTFQKFLKIGEIAFLPFLDTFQKCL